MPLRKDGKPDGAHRGIRECTRCFEGQSVAIAKFSEHFDLRGLIGRGTFGEVRVRETQCDFAAKLIENSIESRREIEREACMLSRVSHPCIVKFGGLYSNDNFICFILDLYKGGDATAGMLRHFRIMATSPCRGFRSSPR